MTNHISCECKYKLHSTACNSNQKWNNKTKYKSAKKIIVGILAHVFVRIANI